jgi:hypothetical protein
MSDMEPSKFYIDPKVVEAAADLDDGTYADARIDMAKRNACPVEELDRRRQMVIDNRNGAPPAEVKQWVERLNEDFFIVENLGNRCRVAWHKRDPHPDLKGRRVLGHTSFEDFQNRYRATKIVVGQDREGNPITKNLGTVWLDHCEHRQYESITFAPGQDLGRKIFNLWKGFSVQPKEGDFSLYLDHLRQVICRGNPSLYDYLIQWMARAVQYPGERGHTALVFRGEKGTGKNIAADALGLLFGAHSLAVANALHIVGNFNAHLRDTCLLIANEAFYAGDKKHEAVLKTIVTDNILPIEAKYLDVVAAPNLLHLIIISNSSWVVPASADERRFAFFEVSNEKKGDIPYFKAIADQLEKGGYQTLLHHMLTLDISRFDPRFVPTTEGLRTQMSESLTGIEAAWFECLQRGEIPGNVIADGTVQLRSSKLIEWAGKQDHRWRGIRDQQVGYLFKGNLRRHAGNRGMEFNKTQIDHAGQRRQTWLIPTLADCRKLWNEKRFDVDWDVSGREAWCANFDMLDL